MKDIHPVAILTTKNDTSTYKVMSYLEKSNFPYVLYFDAAKLYDSLYHKKNKYSAIWLRRQNFRVYSSDCVGLLKECTVLNHYYQYKLESHNNVLGSILRDFTHNKLIDLDLAHQCGLNTPYSKIVDNKFELISILEEGKFNKYITKALFNISNFVIDNEFYLGGFPILISKDEIKLLEDGSFFPSLIQEYIDKKFEIRIFFLCGKFYSMAIFSQQDSKTMIDYRNYNDENPNRNIPFSIPREIRIKLKNFMKLKKLNMGSIDMIFTTDDKFIFLEVNSIGQFGWLSENCNYYIEKEISSVLTKKM